MAGNNINYWEVQDMDKVSSQIRPDMIKKSNSDLSVDDFLQIMAAEISNQSMAGDSGGSKTDYITQLAQFTTLEQLNVMADSISKLSYIAQQNQAFSLVGKDVVYINDKGDKVEGIVDKVKFTADGTLITAGKDEFPIGFVVEVLDKKEAVIDDKVGEEKPQAGEK